MKPPLTILTDTPPTLTEAQALVEGYVERVVLRTRPIQILLVNEEGRLHQLPRNEEASQLSGFHIVGPAVLLRGPARKGWK